MIQIPNILKEMNADFIPCISLYMQGMVRAWVGWITVSHG